MSDLKETKCYELSTEEKVKLLNLISQEISRLTELFNKIQNLE